MGTSREEFEKLVARQEELIRQMHVLGEEMQVFATQLPAPDIAPARRRPIDAATLEAILARFDAARERTMQGRIFAENATDIVRRFREDRHSFDDE